MKANIPLAPRSQWVARRFAFLGSLVAILVVVLFGAPRLVFAGDTNSPPPQVKPPEPQKPAKQLSGAELYAIHCNRCHPERYPEEFNQDKWKTVMTHMRVRANLPAEQARVIMKYLQDQGGN